MIIEVWHADSLAGPMKAPGSLRSFRRSRKAMSLLIFRDEKSARTPIAGVFHKKGEEMAALDYLAVT
ncbi:MAG: hypothetical protein ACYC5X_09020 [Syntrophales bacterium]